MAIQTPFCESRQRSVWNFHRADWRRLRGALGAIDWGKCFGSNVECNVLALTKTLMNLVAKFVPVKTFRETKTGQSWINDKCVAAIRAKVAATGTEHFCEVSNTCSAVIAEEYHNYAKNLREQIAGLPKGSKRWWRLNRELLNKQAAHSQVPNLKRSDGV